VTEQAEKPNARTKLLNAAVAVIRAKGYAATSVDDLCGAAGVTKGAFFHHFKSKDDLGVAAAAFWSERSTSLFAAAPYHAHADPLDRVLGYIDFRAGLLKGAIPDFTCLVGTMVQEAYETHPSLRDACARSITGHAASVEPDIAEAMRMHDPCPGWTARSLALHTQAVLQGAFFLAKATGGSEIAADSVDHLRRYVALLFNRDPERPADPGQPASKTIPATARARPARRPLAAQDSASARIRPGRDQA
jgi:TetR/AcrR family transcriptional regulator, transcriptional repressor for nem operon